MDAITTPTAALAPPRTREDLVARLLNGVLIPFNKGQAKETTRRLENEITAILLLTPEDEEPSRTLIEGGKLIAAIEAPLAEEAPRMAEDDLRLAIGMVEKALLLHNKRKFGKSKVTEAEKKDFWQEHLFLFAVLATLLKWRDGEVHDRDYLLLRVFPLQTSFRTSASR